MSDNWFLILFVVGMILMSAIVSIVSDDYLRRDIANTKFWKWLTKFWNNFWV